MDRSKVLSIAKYLEKNNIKPYDLWIAAGLAAKSRKIKSSLLSKVPTRIRQQKIARMKESGSMSPEGFVNLAIRDLSKMNFPAKKLIIDSLKQALKDDYVQDVAESITRKPRVIIEELNAS